MLGLSKEGGGYFTARRAALNVVCYWIVSIIINGPLFVWADIVSTRRSVRDCSMKHVDDETLNVYIFVKVLFVFFTPLAITWTAYCYIIYRTHKAWKTVIYTFIRSRHFAHPSSKFYRGKGVKKCEILPRLSTPVAFDGRGFKTEQLIGILKHLTGTAIIHLPYD